MWSKKRFILRFLMYSEEDIFNKVQANQTCEMKKSNFTIFHFLRGKIMILMYSKSYLWNWFICCYHNIFLPRLIKIFWPAVKYVRNQFIIPSPWCCNQIQGHFFKNFFFALYWIVCVYLSTFFGVNSG